MGTPTQSVIRPRAPEARCSTYLHPALDQEALEPTDARLDERAELARVPGDDAAPEADVNPALPAGGRALRLQVRHRRRRRDRVERHVDERGDAAGRGGARARPEALPLGAAGLIQVNMCAGMRSAMRARKDKVGHALDETGQDPEVARIDVVHIGKVGTWAFACVHGGNLAGRIDFDRRWTRPVGSMNKDVRPDKDAGCRRHEEEQEPGSDNDAVLTMRDRMGFDNDLLKRTLVQTIA
jgi:hypothetical protein